MLFVSQLRRRWLRRLPLGLAPVNFVLFLSITAVCFYFLYEPPLLPISIQTIVGVGKDDMNGVGRTHRVFSTGCTIPKLETYGAEMMPFIEKATPVDCRERAGTGNWVRVDEKGRLTKIKERVKAKCEIEYIARKTDFENELIEREQLVQGQKMKQDFGLVRCRDGRDWWESLLMAAVRNEEVVRQAKKKKEYKGEKPLDVVIFGFDSMSQQHFRRKMPLATKQLEKMGAVTLNGYNIVGDGTPQAFIPILTGKTELELPNTRRRYKTANFVDVYPFVWKNFSDRGYATLFGEDAFSVGMFAYRLKGFDKQPTDHYTRNFFKEVESQKGNGRKNGGNCLGSEHVHEAWFRYSRHFLAEYPDLPKFLLMHQDSLSHDNVNQIEVEDEYFAGHLADLENDGLLDNAMVIVMADHGHRFMKIRDTHQGQLEERLPMFSVVLPKKLRATPRGKRMYANLLANRDVLTTPFDVHQTLLDILNPLEDLTALQDTKRRSLSLLRPIPKARTCEEADIEAHWCTCLNWHNATATPLDVEQTKLVAEGLVKAIDGQLGMVRHLCANVTLKKVVSASKLTPNPDLLSYKDVKDADGFVPAFKAEARAVFALYQLKVVTSPNDAIYEGTVYFDGRKGMLEVDFQSLSHVNAYGDDPHCVVQKHNTLTLYCRPSYKALFLLLVLVLVFLLLHSPAEDGVNKIRVVVVGRDDMNGHKRAKRVFSDSTGCNFPKLETFGAELMKFIEKTPPLKCKEEENWVYVDENGRLTLIATKTKANCEVEYRRRKTDYDNLTVKKVPFVDGMTAEEDISIVTCTLGKEKWSLPLLTVKRDEELVSRLKTKRKGDDQLDVLLISFDSTSHQHFRRKMPLTTKQLEKMGTVIMDGYNIVGDGTPQAFIPILTGKTELELPNTRRRYKTANFVDVYPFVWKNFSDRGYATLFGEDDYSIGMFTYRLKGFDKQPTDHYTRNYFKEAKGHAQGQPVCIGSEEMYKMWFRYPREFFQKYKDVPKFAVVHQGLYSHDDINLIEVQDVHFAEQLALWEEKKLLEKTVLIVMADHGHRFMKIRDTHQGQLEERLPLMSITLPRKFRETERGKKVYENLFGNRNHLTTPFDLYSMFWHILEPSEDLITPQDKKKRSLDMFRPIPKERTCEDAGVEAHWCTCLNWQNALETSADRKQTLILAEGLVKAIDDQLANVRHLCAQVSFKNIVSATKLIPNDNLLKYKDAKDKDGFVPKLTGNTATRFAHYRLKVTTSPNDAVYEATVFYDGRVNELEVDFQSLSHVSPYGDDPHCVVKTHNTLSLFCVCHDRVKK